MIVLLLTIPLIAYISMIAFRTLGWTVINYEGYSVPYSLGSVILYGYATFSVIVPSEMSYIAFSYPALMYVVGIWILGFIDDRYGSKEPKGLKGHLYFFWKKRLPTTGLIKLLGTFTLALLFVYYLQVTSLYEAVRYFLLLSWMPHMMNLFDTRPLRVWKLSTLIIVPMLLSYPAPAFFLLIYGLAIYYLLFVLEGHRQALLGDNGSTTMGAIIALMFIQFSPPSVQWVVLFFVGLMIFIAERISFSKVISESGFLRWIDGIGVPYQQK
ncbi:hypothetical protein RYX56_12420 [Alkalihalophilus lindianensis]|uniref:Uncharacterized protein n=1 Tax=Alkalihalophilus lindianensis TaxID=1630542 RepID=A0ABU3XB95_9BACI|nr:hypothetical protein [Alkalihalophilus lindianensis]MDV2685162.1 hypothetical protein [Alkalihalophilus lindianensis]